LFDSDWGGEEKEKVFRGAQRGKEGGGKYGKKLVLVETHAFHIWKKGKSGQVP